MASNEVGKLTIGVGLDDKGVKKDLKSVESEAVKTGEAVKQHSVAVSAAISAIVNKAIDGATKAAGAAVKVVGDSVNAFADYEQLVGGVETLFGDAAGAVQQYADKAFQTAGLSANEYMSTVTSFSARLLQGLGGDTQKAAQIGDMAVTDMADNANKMGSSMQSIQDAYQGFAKQNYTMLDNLKLGYGGTQSEMARLINESGVLGSTMKVTAETVNDVSFDKIIEAIHVTQERLEITGTTSKEAATTIQGSVASMKGAWTNMMVAMTRESGDFAGPVDALVETIQTAASNIVPALYRAMTGFSELISQVAPTLTAMIPQLVTEIVPSAILLLTDVILALVQALPSTLSALVGAIVSTLPDFISTIAQAIPPLLAEIVNAVIEIARMLTEPPMINQIIAAAITLLMSIVQAIPLIIPPLVSALPTIINNILTVLVQNIPLILNGALQLFMALVDALPTIVSSLTAALPQVLNAIVSFLTNPESIMGILNAAITVFYALIDALPTIIEALSAALPDILTALVDYFTNPGTIATLLQAAVTLFFALVDAVPRILGALMASFGALVGNLWNGITAMFGRFAENFGNFISGAFKGAINGVLSFIEGFINSPIKILNGFIDIINGVFGAVGVNLGHIDLVQLPRMAQGGYANNATAAVFGEAGKEVALPLERNTDNWSGLLAAALAEEFELGEVAGTSGRPIENTQNIYINDKMDIRKVGNAFLQEVRRAA